MSKTVFMRGLQNFISDIRACENKEQEQRRVDKELAKVREKFGEQDKSLSGYDRRKYVWKLLYIYMLGYDIDFGHKQACDLIPMPKYKDKQVGYMACSLLFQENDEFLRLAINGIHMDLISRNEAFECLALNFVGSVGGAEMAEALTQDIIKLVTSGAARPIVKKRAALCLLKMIRKTPHEQQVVQADTFCSILASLLEEQDMGLLLSSMTLLYGILLRNGSAGYESLLGRCIRIMERLIAVKDKSMPAEYLYYGIPSPWLQCRTLRVLQFYPLPENPTDRASLISILQSILSTAEKSVSSTAGSAASATGGGGGGAAASGVNVNQNKSNAMNSILFEAIALCLTLDIDKEMLMKCVTTLNQMLTVKESNVKYLALENLSRLAQFPDILVAIRAHQTTVLQSLRDPDISIRRRALDLLFTMCDQSNAPEIVGELLQYLVAADFSLREELVLKTAILAEKFAPSVQWYVDVVLQLLERAGDFVSDDIWHRVVQLVSNNESMQQYAARNVVETLKRGATHESLICASAYILGEFGRQIAGEVAPMDQFKLLYSVFPAANQITKGLLMTSFIKIYLLDPNNAALKAEVSQLFERYKRYMDAELQQRASEYMRLVEKPQAASANFLMPMPKWPERESNLLRQLQKTEGVSEDAAIKTDSPTKASSDVAPSGHFQLAPLAPTPSFDLLGGDSLPAPVPGQLDVLSGLVGAGGPPASSNPVDILSDLLSDSLVSSRGAPAAAYSAAGPTAFPVPAAAAASSAPSSSFSTGPPAQGAPFAGASAPWGAAPQQQQQPQSFYAAPAPAGWSQSQSLPSPSPVDLSQAQALSLPTTSLPAQPMSSQEHDPFAPAAATFTGAVVGTTAAFAPTAGMTQPYRAPPLPPPYASVFAPQPLAAQTSDPFASMAAANAAVQSGMPLFLPPGAQMSGTHTSLAPTTMSAPQHLHSQASDPFASMAAASEPRPSASFSSPSSGVAPSATAAAVGATAGAAAAWGGSSTFNRDDPFGDNAFGPPPPPPPPPMPQYEPARPTGDIGTWYSQLLLKPRGILYEDQYLQVGVQSSYNRGQGEFLLYLGNKNGEQPLTNLSFTVTSPSPSVQLTVGQAPAMLGSKQQMQVPIQVLSLAPGVEPPSVLLAYTLCNVVVSQQLRLPVANHKFLIPEPTISQDQFFDQWKALSQPPNKAQEMFEHSGAISLNSIMSLLRAANLGVEHGHLDPSPYNEAGAGYFIAGPPGQEQLTLVMCRIEGNPQTMSQFRVTVQSTQPTLSATFKDLIVSQMRVLPA